AVFELADDVLRVLETVERTPDGDILAMAMRSDQARALTALEGYTAGVEAAYERLLESVGSADVPQVYPILRGLAGLFSFRGENDRSNVIAPKILQFADGRATTAVQ